MLGDGNPAELEAMMQSMDPDALGLDMAATAHVSRRSAPIRSCPVARICHRA